MLSQQDEETLTAAAKELARSDAIFLFLTSYKKSCIDDLTQDAASQEALWEANRRYQVADDLEARIRRYAER